MPRAEHKGARLTRKRQTKPGGLTRGIDRLFPKQGPCLIHGDLTRVGDPGAVAKCCFHGLAARIHAHEQPRTALGIAGFSSILKEHGCSEITAPKILHGDPHRSVRQHITLNGRSLHLQQLFAARCGKQFHLSAANGAFRAAVRMQQHLHSRLSRHGALGMQHGHQQQVFSRLQVFCDGFKPLFHVPSPRLNQMHYCYSIAAFCEKGNVRTLCNCVEVSYNDRMNAWIHSGETQEDAKKTRGISEHTLVLTVVLVFALTFGLLAYYYHALSKGTLAPTPTPAPPTATPIVDANGDPAPIHAYFLDLQGECFFAKAANGETLLVDAGCASDAAAVSAFLTAQNITKLDAVFLSLAEEKYLGGMLPLIGRFDIGTFYLTPETAQDPRCKALLSVLEDNGIPMELVHASFVSTVDWAENAELRILSPHDVRYPNATDESLMLRLAYGSSEILLAASAGELAERMAVKALPNSLLHADVLKLSEQGSAAGSSAKFLGAVKPTIAVVCGSATDALPAKSVQSALEQLGATILRTAERGTIEFVLDGVTAQMVE